MQQPAAAPSHTTIVVDEIDVLREQLANAEEAVLNCQKLLCTLRSADVQAAQEVELVELTEARDFMRARLERLLSREVDEG